MEEPCVLYRKGIANSRKETDKTKSNHSPSDKDALKLEMKHKIEGNASPGSPMVLRKKLSIAMGVGRFSNLSNEKTEKGDNSCYSPHSDSGYIQEFRVSYGRNVTNAVKENDMRKSNVRVKHDMKRKMAGNVSPRSPMILRKRPSVAMSPSRFRNSSNGKREKGDDKCYSQPMEDSVSYERSIPDIAEENDMKKSIHQSHIKKYPSTKDVWPKDKMKHKTELNASPRSSMIHRNLRSTNIASRFKNLFTQGEENDYDSCRGNFPSAGSSPHGDSRKNCTGKSMCLRCSKLTRKNDDSHHRFCSCCTEVVDELAASFEDSEGHQMKTSCSDETQRSDGGYDLSVECKQPGSLVDSRYVGVSYGRNVTNVVKENDMRKSNVRVKHDMKRKMAGNVSPRSPMILRKRPSVAMSPSRFRNSSNGKREKGDDKCFSQPMEDSVSYERSIPDIAEEKDMKKSIHQSHIKKSPSTRNVWAKDKMKHKTEGNASPRSSMIHRNLRSTTIASRFKNLFTQGEENDYDSCRGNFPSAGSSPHGDSGMNCTGKSTCLRCSKLTRKSDDSHHRFCSCSTKVVDELAASFEDSEKHQMKTSCSGETQWSDGSYDLSVECKQPGSLVDSRYVGVSYGRNVANAVKENNTRKSNVCVKHDIKRKMAGNANPRSPMVLRKKPYIAMSPSRFRNSSNGKKEKGNSRPMEDPVSYERRIPDISEEKDMRKSIHQSHIKNSSSIKDVCVNDKMKYKTEGNARPRSSMILRKMQSITIASGFENLFIQGEENGYDSCRGKFSSAGSSPHGDSGMNCTGKSTYLRCSKLTRKSNDSHHRFCLCSTEVVDELAAPFEDSEGHQMKTSCSDETRQSDGSYDLCVECKQSGSLVRCGGKDCKAGCHSSCSVPTLNGAQCGTWLCFCCLQKKMMFGVYSISQGIESIFFSTDDVGDEKHYFVKFNGLAHIHNSWIPRSKLLIEDPLLLSEFHEKS